jgi:hypothetical protein
MRKGSSSFLKKRTKKLLFLEASVAAIADAHNAKVLHFFSSEKKTLLFLLLSIKRLLGALAASLLSVPSVAAGLPHATGETVKADRLPFADTGKHPAR